MRRIELRVTSPLQMIMMENEKHHAAVVRRLENEIGNRVVSPHISPTTNTTCHIITSPYVERRHVEFFVISNYKIEIFPTITLNSVFDSSM